MSAPYYMPAEWEKHERCWMAWPCREEVWPDIAKVRSSYAGVAHAIREFEQVTMLVPPQLKASALNELGSDIEIIEMPIDDSWARDSGPTFVVDGQGGLKGVCYTFNAWGEKYQPYDQDALMARRILQTIGVDCISSPLVAEGGGMCSDGEGTVLTTDTCFPNKNRNPDWRQVDIDAELGRTVGAEKVIWLPGDPDDDETDGHVDGLATFIRPGVVLLESTSEQCGHRADFYRKAREVMESQRDARGRTFELISLPEATDVEARGDRFCRSYVNFYYANGAIIAPAYGIKMDDEVKERLQSIFPERVIRLVAVNHIAEGGGGIHCITQQQPARCLRRPLLRQIT